MVIHYIFPPSEPSNITGRIAIKAHFISWLALTAHIKRPFTLPNESATLNYIFALIKSKDMNFKGQWEKLHEISENVSVQ